MKTRKKVSHLLRTFAELEEVVKQYRKKTISTNFFTKNYERIIKKV